MSTPSWRALVGTFLEKQEFDNRLQIDHAPIGDVFGGVGSTFTYNHFNSRGPEVNTPESFTRNFALYLVENYERERFRFQLGGRWEAQGVEVIGRRNARLTQSYHALSLSAGLEFEITENWKLSGNWSFAQRPPATAELFSNGAHLATGTYEIGGFYAIPGVPEGGVLDIEQSRNFELTLERTGERVSGSFTYFQYDFDNYIFLSSLGPGWEINGLPIFRYIQREARFRGVEWETKFHLLPDDGDRHLDFTAMLDWVRADDLTANTPLPRTPPLRIGGRLEYEKGPWRLGVELRRAAAMNRTQQTFETPTEGFTQLNADIRWTHLWGDRATTFFIKGSNLTDELIRNHVSVIKDVAPLPGRSVTVGLTVRF
jgi:iron complex outermembrane receptor protein